MRIVALLLLFIALHSSAIAQHVPASPQDRPYLLSVLAEATSDTGHIDAQSKQIFWLLAPDQFKNALLVDPQKRQDLVERFWACHGEWLASLRLTLERGVATLTPSFETSRQTSNAAFQEVLWLLIGERVEGPFSSEAAEAMVQAVANAEPIDFFSQGRMVLTVEAIERAEEMHKAAVDRTYFLFTP